MTYRRDTFAVSQAEMACDTTRRGYGNAHQRRRREFQRRLDAGEVFTCSRCGRVIARGMPWDLGHHDIDKTLPTQPEHRRCNRATNRSGRLNRPRQPQRDTMVGVWDLGAVRAKLAGSEAPIAQRLQQQQHSLRTSRVW